jgi:hypothetical protein
MTNHGDVKTLSQSSQITDKTAKEFADLTSDINDLFANNPDSKTLGLLLFKLAQERQQTNKLLEKLADQYDNVMFQLKTSLPDHSLSARSPGEFINPPRPPSESDPPVRSRPVVRVLADQDQFILKMVEQSGQINADQVREELGYKGKNAASQRLNMLVREGHLRKIQAGRNVVFMVRIP